MDELKQANAKKRMPNDAEIDLIEIFQLMLQKIWIIILCFVIGAGLAFGYTKLMITPMYAASSEIYILTKTTSVTSLADLQLGSQLTADFEAIAKTRPVVEAVIEDLGLDYTYEQLVGRITTENPASTRFLKFTVIHEDPEMARDIANSLAEATSERVAQVMTTDKPNVVEDAVTPKAPYSPSTLKNTVMGALLGACLAMAVILISYMMNDTIQTEEDVRKYLNLHTLAAIPFEKRR